MAADSARSRAALLAASCARLSRERFKIAIVVLGARGDRICSVEDVEATAGYQDIARQFVLGLAHLLMLEPEWKLVAEVLARWIDAVG